MNVLSADNISKSYSERWLFKNISFGINEGERVALVGKNGTGKTTFLNVLAQQISSDTGVVSFRKGASVGYLGQNPVFQEEKTVYENIFSSNSEVVSTVQAYEDCLANVEDTEAYHARFQDIMERMEELKAWDYEKKVKHIVNKLGIGPLEQKKVNQLSGGQRKRVALARVLIEEPELLIMDEPTNHLDLETIEWLENVILDRFRSVLIVTHDRYFLDNVANEIVELDDSQLYRYKGNYAYYLEKKAERDMAKNSEIDRARNLMRKELEWMRRQPKARGTKAKYRVDAFQDLQQKAQQQKSESKLELNVQAARQGGKVLEVKKLEKKFGNQTIVHDFNYVFRKREKIGVVGKNGIGKSTFLNMLLKNVPPDSGEVDPGQTTVFGYYSQEEIRLEDDKRVIEVVKEIADYVTLGDGTTITASQLLTHFLFPPAMQYNNVSKLSGGERRRLQLLKVLIKNPNFLVLDEPTNDFDIESLNVLEDFLLNFEGCLLLVSHDRYFMDRLVDHVFVFEGDGNVKDFPGNYTEYRSWKEEQGEIVEQTKPSSSAEVVLVAPVQKTASSSTTTAKKKLSFKDRQEMESLEKEIAQLERKKKDWIEKMNAGGLGHAELSETASNLDRLEAELEVKTLRWMELSEE